jgi:hypothetical protein
VKFGISWDSLSLYCQCTELLSVRHYIIGTAMPAVLLGMIPLVIGYFNGNIFYLLFGIFFTLAAAGDFLIIRSLSKEKADDLVLDHPEEIGYFIFRK